MQKYIQKNPKIVDDFTTLFNNFFNLFYFFIINFYRAFERNIK